MNRIINHKKPSVLLTVILAGCVLVLGWAFFQDNYASMKDDTIIKPPFGGYMGMTLEEVCSTLEISESELIPAPSFDSDAYGYRLSIQEEFYNKKRDQMLLLDHYSNTYYVAYDEAIFGEKNFFVDDYPSHIRLIFTDETNWNEKTIPPLLCAIAFAYNANCDIHAIAENLKNSIDGEYEIPQGVTTFGSPTDLNRNTIHIKAELLSGMYTIGMTPEEINNADVLNLDKDEIAKWNSKINATEDEAVRNITPNISSRRNIPDMYGKNPDADFTSLFVVIDAGYLAYYEWFLNELT